MDSIGIAFACCGLSQAISSGMVADCNIPASRLMQMNRMTLIGITVGPVTSFFKRQ